MKNPKRFKSLGKKTLGFPAKPSKDILEAFDNQHPNSLYLVPLICSEFTSICPITGQPDFAKFEIVYAPRVKMVESKSLKLYLFSFRNHGEFHEDVTNRIFNDLWNLMNPRFMRIIGDFSVRGGIAIKPMVQKFAEDADKEELFMMLQSWDNAKSKL
jgi:7-cyano-7-deazaguanine reductase